MSSSVSGPGSAPPSHSRADTKPRKPQLTHFLCIPLHNATPQLHHSLAALQHDLTAANLVSVSAIRPIVTLHLTLGVMSLTSPPQLQRAKEFLETDFDPAGILRSLSPSAEVEPLTIDLRGLEAMGSKWRTSVLYAVPCDATGRLGVFAQAVRDVFVKEGLVLEEEREMKLHATVVNTVYSREGGRDGGRGGRGRGGRWARNQKVTFDAAGLIDRYRDVSFADGVGLDKIAVCRMGEVRAEDGTSEGYLVCGEKTF